MKEIIMPPSTDSGTPMDNLPPGYKKYAVPESLQEKDQINLFYEQVQAVVRKQIELEQTISRYKNEVDEYSKDLKKQSNRNIEILGLFSSVLALLIINVNIVINADTLFTSIMLIIGLTSSVAIFSLLIHRLFDSESGKLFNKTFWIPVSLLIILLIFGAISHLLHLSI